MHDIEELARIAVDCGFQIHKELGPGLLESVYEAVLANSLLRVGLPIERQKPILIEYDGQALGEGFRADIVVDQRLIIEIKSVERMAPVHGKQLLTYLRLAKQPVGLLMNFGCETFSGRLETCRERSHQLRVFAPSCEPVCLRAGRLDPRPAIP